MVDLFWPGGERAGELMTGTSLVEAMLAVESAWLDALVAEKLAPGEAGARLAGLVGSADVEALSAGSEAGGNPVIPFLALLRSRLREPHPAAATWVHRGLTSQDVLDTSLMLCTGAVVDRINQDLRSQVASLSQLAETHRSTMMVGRTLTQHAVPITFGLKVAGWLDGVLDAAALVRSLRTRLPAQLGGAAGTLAASTELARLQGAADPDAVAWRLVEATASSLGLATRAPWHTSRAIVTQLGDAFVGCTDAWGRLANDVLIGSRPEIAELAEPSGEGRGGSSTMPHKHNPVLSVLVRRAALAAPALGSTLHAAAAGMVDERPDGAWHVEWATLRTLARRTAIAASQTTELLAGLHVDVDRMARTLESSAPSTTAEQDSIVALAGGEAEGLYLGASDRIIDATLDRGRAYLEEKL